MENDVRKWLPLAIIAAMIAASWFALRDLPSTVTIDLRGLLPVALEPAGDKGPKWLAILAMPAVATVVWALFRLLRGAAGLRIARLLYGDVPDALGDAATIERFRSTYDTIALWVVILVLGVHAGMIAAALGRDALAARIIVVVIGISLAAAGNVMPRLRPNLVAGVRTRATLTDPQLWRATHRVLGAGFVVAGLLTVVVGLIAPHYGIVTAVAGLVIALVVTTIGGLRGRRATAAVLLALALVGARASGASPQAPGAPPIVELTAPESVIEQPFSFERAGLTLRGTLALPAASTGALPVVLMVAGSGPTDRNANGPAINTNMYAMLAWELAKAGVATVRYDKRGIGASVRAGGNPLALTLDDYVADVMAAAASLAADARFSRVFLLGHSEGAGLVLQAANRGAVVAGVMMVSPQGRPLAELLHEQFSRQLDSTSVAAIDTAFARYLRGEEPGDVPPVARPVMIPAYRNFMRSMAAYDPPAEAKRVRQPLLVLHGSTDVQTTLADARLLVAAQPAAKLVVLEGVNHVLKAVPTTDLTLQEKSYRDPHLPLAPDVARVVVQFVAGDR